MGHARNWGKVPPGSMLRWNLFDSYDGATGASEAISGLAVTDIEIYKDGSVTQRSSDNGYTLLGTNGIDFDGITGINGFQVDLSDNSDAGFYAAGSKYAIVVSSITADGQTVNFTAGVFEIGYPSSFHDTTIATLASQTSFTLTVGPAEDDALNDCWAIVHDVASAVQKAIVQISDYTGSTKTVTLAAGATFTVAATDNISIMGPMPIQPTVAARNAIADALLDRADAVETGLTPRQAMRLEAAASAGKLSGAATTSVVIRNAVADSKNRITATVDADGNRTAVSTDVT